MIFANRQEAGRQLAVALRKYANSEDVVVLGISPGGVSVAFEIAKALHVRLDILLSRKLRAPGEEELVFGAIVAGDGYVLNEAIIEEAGISADQVEQMTRAAKAKLEERTKLYRGTRPPLCFEAKTVILIDDGIGTGGCMHAAIHAMQKMKPKKLIVAVPLAPYPPRDRLQRKVDEFIVLYSPQDFHRVGQYYRQFPQVSDEEVADLLGKAERTLVPATVP